MWEVEAEVLPPCQDSVHPSPRSTTSCHWALVDPCAVGGGRGGCGLNPPDWINNSGVHGGSQVVCCAHLFMKPRITRARTGGKRECQDPPPRQRNGSRQRTSLPSRRRARCG